MDNVQILPSRGYKALDNQLPAEAPRGGGVRGGRAGGRVALSGGRLARSDCIQLARTTKARPAVRGAGAWWPQPLDTTHEHLIVAD